MLAHRPEEFRAFMAYHDTLMDRSEGLTKAEREMIVVAISALNQCQYCVVAHAPSCASARGTADRRPGRGQLAQGRHHRQAEGDAEFAVKVTLRANEVNEADHEALRQAGFDGEAIWDIAAIAAFFGMSNRLANVTNLRPNDEFYAMGRG